jgi:hypothetical protein
MKSNNRHHTKCLPSFALLCHPLSPFEAILAESSDVTVKRENTKRKTRAVVVSLLLRRTRHGLPPSPSDAVCVTKIFDVACNSPNDQCGWTLTNDHQRTNLPLPPFPIP